MVATSIAKFLNRYVFLCFATILVKKTFTQIFHLMVLMFGNVTLTVNVTDSSSSNIFNLLNGCNFDRHFM